VRGDFYGGKNMDKTFQWAIATILSKISPEFYGSFTIMFEAGKLVRVKTEQIERPEKHV
jgi:hypothetical protein